MQKKSKWWQKFGTYFLIVASIFFLTSLIPKGKTKIMTQTKPIKLQELSEESWNQSSAIVSNNQKRTIDDSMKAEIGGYQVLGKLTIPKVDLEKYILEKTDERAMKLGLTKLYGPNMNEEGNFCIIGHNYTSSFGKLKKLEIGDEFFLTDIYGRTVRYMIYDIRKVSPENTDCLNQDTKREREASLITCTLGAIQRLVLKGIEVYD